MAVLARHCRCPGGSAGSLRARRTLTMNETRYFVRHGGRVPQDMVEFFKREEGQVRFFPAGGGFEHRMPADAFDATHRSVLADEIAAVRAHAAVFDIEES